MIANEPSTGFSFNKFSIFSGRKFAAGNILRVGRVSRPVRIEWDGPGDPSYVIRSRDLNVFGQEDSKPLNAEYGLC